MLTPWHLIAIHWPDTIPSGSSWTSDMPIYADTVPGHKPSTSGHCGRAPHTHTDTHTAGPAVLVHSQQFIRLIHQAFALRSQMITCLRTTSNTVWKLVENYGWVIMLNSGRLWQNFNRLWCNFGILWQDRNLVDYNRTSIGYDGRNFGILWQDYGKI